MGCGVNSWKIFPRSCNWACTLKNPCCGGWKISVGRLLLINLLGSEYVTEAHVTLWTRQSDNNLQKPACALRSDCLRRLVHIAYIIISCIYAACSKYLYVVGDIPVWGHFPYGWRDVGDSKYCGVGSIYWRWQNYCLHTIHEIPLRQFRWVVYMHCSVIGGLCFLRIIVQCSIAFGLKIILQRRF